MRTCLVCGADTEGSIGASGIKWNRICQPCKDSEDNTALEQVKAFNKGIDKALSARYDGTFWDDMGI